MSVVSQVSKDCVLFCFELLGFYLDGIDFRRALFVDYMYFVYI